MTPEPLWQQYERSVHKVLAEFDPAATVLHDRQLDGRLSGAKRQVDIWASGSVAGATVTIAIECKRYRRAVGIGTVDEFAGKLQDLDVDRGILYSYSGFTQAAANRAANSWPPKIQAVELEPPVLPSGQLSEAAERAAPGEPAFMDHYAALPAELTSERIIRFLVHGEWIGS
ncbi:restriction endonuclease [Kribbella sp. NBC_01505]|uniref:restriction endonuclease n=1 Tax=Kribbella sp. NBC_01505 TaxID=2903580 RepID=UPI0038669412